MESNNHLMLFFQQLNLLEIYGTKKVQLEPISYIYIYILGEQNLSSLHYFLGVRKICIGRGGAS